MEKPRIAMHTGGGGKRTSRETRDMAEPLPHDATLCEP